MKLLFIPKLILSVGLIISLSACDLIPFNSPLQNICKDIALSRLKHPSSYDYISISEISDAEDEITIQLDFNAWNDYKVPMLHSISCQFQDVAEKGSPLLTIVKWNGRPIRQHELDDIRASISNLH